MIFQFMRVAFQSRHKLIYWAYKNGKDHLQRLYTHQVERHQMATLKTDFLALPRTEERRKAFLNKGELASAWVTAWPEPELRLENTLFAEVVATYFGLPSPAATLLNGMRMRNGREVDRFANNLSALSPYKGDGFRTRHAAVKLTVVDVARKCSVRAEAEVLNLFSAQLSAAQRANFSRANDYRTRQSYVPDILLHFPPPDDPQDPLLEVKGITPCPTWYPENGANADEPFYGVYMASTSGPRKWRRNATRRPTRLTSSSVVPKTRPMRQTEVRWSKPCGPWRVRSRLSLGRMVRRTRSSSRSWPRLQQLEPAPNGSGSCSRVRSWPLGSSPGACGARSVWPSLGQMPSSSEAGCCSCWACRRIRHSRERRLLGFVCGRGMAGATGLRDGYGVPASTSPAQWSVMGCRRSANPSHPLPPPPHTHTYPHTFPIRFHSSNKGMSHLALPFYRFHSINK